MTEHLRAAVMRALDAAQIPHRGRGAFLEVDIPARFRHKFGNRRQLELSFNPDAWDPTFEVELVTPGCAFLDSLEDVLRQLGTARSVWIGGDFSPRPALIERWTKDFKIFGGTLAESSGRFATRQLLRFLFEVRLPGPPPRTELIPLVWDVGRRAVLSSSQVAPLLKRPWYGEHEVAGMVDNAVPPLSAALQARAERECGAELSRRLAPVVANADAALRDRVAAEKDELLADLRERLRDADFDQRALIEEEHQRRVGLLQQQLQKVYGAKISSVTYLVHLIQSPLFVYEHGRTHERVEIEPQVRVNKIIDAQCAYCNSSRHQYLLAPNVSETPPLVCTSCGTACQDAACSVVLRRSDASSCHVCGAPRWCAKHCTACDHCGKQTCPDHLQSVDCCERKVCTKHVGLSPDGARRFCHLHARQCSVDEAWYLEEEGVTCAVTGRWLAETNAVYADDDERALHPDGRVRCASSGVWVARDHARPCGVDQQLHHPSELRTSARDELTLCPEHRVVADLPSEQVIDRRRARRCADTQMVCHEADLSKCEATGKRVFKALLITCPVTTKRLLSTAARSLPDDPRQLHPAALVRCGVSDRLVAVDRAVEEAVVSGRMLHPAEVARCELTGLLGAKRSVVRLQCCSRRAIYEAQQPNISRRFLRSPMGNGWVCTDHYGRCATGNHVVSRKDLKVSATTKDELCSEHRQRCDCHGDFHEHENIWRTPYLATQFCQRVKVAACPRCGMATRTTNPTQPGDCEWCLLKTTLIDADAVAKAVYGEFVMPRLPWYWLRPRVFVSGTKLMWVFEVSFISSRRLFRVSSESKLAEWSSTLGWEEL